MPEARGPDRAERGIKYIRNRAMDVTLVYERAHGRDPKDVSTSRQGYDIVSGDRKIEVKGQGASWKKIKSDSIHLTENELQNATHLYIVCDVYGSCDLHIFEFSKIPARAVKKKTLYLLYMARCRDYELKEDRLID